MKVLPEDAITEVILNHPQHMDFTEKVEFAREIEDLQDRLTEMWGEMGAYARDRVGLLVAEL